VRKLWTTGVLKIRGISRRERNVIVRRGEKRKKNTGGITKSKKPIEKLHERIIPSYLWPKKESKNMVKTVKKRSDNSKKKKKV